MSRMLASLLVLLAAADARGAPEESLQLEGLDLSEPTPESSEKPLALQGVDLSGAPADRAKLDAALSLLQQGRAAQAAIGAREVLGDETLAELHPEASLLLARALHAVRLRHAALEALEQTLRLGAGSPLYVPAATLGLQLVKELDDEVLALERVAPWIDDTQPTTLGPDASYRLARWRFLQGLALVEAGDAETAQQSFERARHLARLVPATDPLHAKAVYLEGTALFRQGAHAEALESFKEVVRRNSPRTSARPDLALRSLALMQLARTHYGHRQNRNALFYYDRIDRNSDQWLESLLEASWAHFRVGEYERALGNLVTLSSPFFKDTYLPEALILEAVIYYENCRYNEARELLAEFEQRYTPVQAELERLSHPGDPIWQTLAERRAAGKALGVSAQVASLVLDDPELKRTERALSALAEEMGRVEQAKPLFEGTPLAEELKTNLETSRQALAGYAERLARAKVGRELAQLKDLLGQALRISFDTTTHEKEALEAKLVEDGEKPATMRRYAHTVAVPDERLWWPFDGEYWRDELGTYEYTLTQGCK